VPRLIDIRGMPAQARPKPDWVAIEAAYRSGNGALRAIAKDHGIAEGTIRARAKKHGWVRDPEGTKRERVKALMSGAAQNVTRETMRNIEDEAQQDAADMRLGLAVARLILQRLIEMVESVNDPKEVRVIAESNKIAVETIRRIRGLDDATGQPTIVIQRSFG
jgi:hypothetical protein